MYSVVLMLAMTGGAETPAGGYGCYGGGYGYGGGCYGYGCRGGYGYGCHGGCYGGYAYGCRGYGGCNGCYGGYYGSNGCYGGRAYYGCGGCCGGMAPAAPPPSPAGTPMNMPAEQTRIPAPATLIVTLPTDATLSVDDSPTTSTAERRVFVSPPLAPGKHYSYVLKAEAVRGGQTVTVTKQITVRAGQQTVVPLQLPATTPVAPVALR